jgi:heptosyltransferase-2
VVLFGPKDPRLLAPVGPRVRTVRTGVRCSPCTLRFCPAPVCMTDLGVDLVAERALEMLEEAG